VRLKQSAQNISEPLGHHGYFKGEEIPACEEAGIARCVRRNILMKLRIMHHAKSPATFAKKLPS
jgi:hypothetical protein